MFSCSMHNRSQSSARKSGEGFQKHAQAKRWGWAGFKKHAQGQRRRRFGFDDKNSVAWLHSLVGALKFFAFHGKKQRRFRFLRDMFYTL